MLAGHNHGLLRLWAGPKITGSARKWLRKGEESTLEPLKKTAG
jgi:hypothetical protein